MPKNQTVESTDNKMTSLKPERMERALEMIKASLSSREERGKVSDFDEEVLGLFRAMGNSNEVFNKLVIDPVCKKLSEGTEFSPNDIGRRALITFINEQIDREEKEWQEESESKNEQPSSQVRSRSASSSSKSNQENEFEVIEPINAADNEWIEIKCPEKQTKENEQPSLQVRSRSASPVSNRGNSQERK